MIRLVLVLALVIVIILVLRNKSKKFNSKRSDIYKKIILIIIILALIFFLATSGKFILPQILKIIKIGLPFLTKFIGI